MMSAKKPFHSEKIFWDTDVQTMDFEKHKSFIISRVFERGDVPDIRACRHYYSHETISKVLLQTRYLSPVRLAMASAIIGKPQESFRCYSTTQSSPEHAPF